MSSRSVASSKDLPLMANAHDIQVKHFVLDLTCNLDKNVFTGSITLYLEPCKFGNGFIFDMQSHKLGFGDETLLSAQTEGIQSEVTNRSGGKEFSLVLDSHSLNFTSVEEVCCNGLGAKSSPDYSQYIESGQGVTWSGDACPGEQLNYSVQEWCIRIWKNGVYCPEKFPKIIKIYYETRADGKSLRWCTDQDGNKCVFTAGMWVNNRALMPCQEYGCLSTWHACVTVPPRCTVLMSADTHTAPQQLPNGMSKFNFCSSSPLPSFTLAIAVGQWQCCELHVPHSAQRLENTTCHHSPGCSIPFSRQSQLPCRLFAPQSLLNKVTREFSDYLPKCMSAIQELFGPSPFPRLDIMIYPSCSQDMAMTNPNLIFLSQSLLAGDGSMCIKLAHELSHYWFGLLIGARDWTEEWLSEGFATFSEDLVHARAMHWTEKEVLEQSELRAVLRHGILMDELQNTQQELQYLRPNQGVEQQTDSISVMYVKNGMNPRKQFTQLHYLKGYFLLRYLAELVGLEKFGRVLHEYIKQYHGRMVRSQDFLKLVFENLPELKEKKVMESEIYGEWLDSNTIPAYLLNYRPSASNAAHNAVVDEVQKWETMIAGRKKRQKRRNKKARFSCDVVFQKLCADQLVCLMEKLLQHPAIPNSILAQLHKTYQLGSANADVCHRWCEMVIKYKYEKHYDDVTRFLIDHQAMGVYLYGELIISRSRKQRELAEACFHVVRGEMEEGTRNTVHVMIYGDGGG